MATRLLIAFAIGLFVSAVGRAQVPANDANKYSLIVVTKAVPCPQCIRLEQTLVSPEVARIANQCKVFRYAPNNEIYRLRYAGALPPSEAPTIALARPDGGVIYKASGSSIPEAKDLAAALTKQATLDRSIAVQPQRYTMLHDWSRDGLLQRPRVIPDTVVVKPSINPTVNVAAPNIIFVVIVGLIFLICAGTVLVLVPIGLFLLIR
jgi:hypothetical protein